MGKRSGDGFIAHKAMLVSALSRALSERVTLMDFTIGRRGFVGYLKALAGSNIVKIVPAAVGASETQANGHKRLKVICGANTSYLEDTAWVGEKTPLTFCEVRVSPANIVKPNIGSLELAEALNRVLPFTTSDDARPVLQCVNWIAKEGKLTLVSADGFRLAVVTLDYDGEGQALINREDLRGVANALKRAKRARISFEAGDVSKTDSLIIDTELISYKWFSSGGNYPDYEKLIPKEFNTTAHFDTVEAVRAISSLKVLADSKSYPIDLTIGNGLIVMANPDDKGQAEISADTNGEGYIRVDGSYLAQVLKACGGMVDFSLINAFSPILFSADGYKVVVMPMVTDKAQKEAKAEAKAVAEPKQEPEAKPEPVTEPEVVTKAEVKPRHSRKREKVAVA